MDARYRQSLMLLGFLALFPGSRLLAQASVGLHITALTSAERDTLTQQFEQQRGDVHVVFACVPAGILVLQADGTGEARADLRSRVRSAITPIVAAARITDDQLTLEAAEDACANARNQ